MGNFQRDDNRGGGFRGGNSGGGFRGGNGGGFRGGDRGPVTMHKAVCDECHKNCEVPFRPSGDKPIYCSDCFGGKKGSDDRAPRRDFNDRSAQPSFNKPTQAPDEVKKQLADISTKLDRLASAIEKLSGFKATVSAPAVKPVAVKAPAKKVVAKKKK